MGKITTATFLGKSGTAYDFEVFSADTEFNDISAVYAFTKRTVSDGVGTHEFIYIGESEKLGGRKESHEKWDCISRQNGNCICVHAVIGNQNRLNIETDLLSANNPTCND